MKKLLIQGNNELSGIVKVPGSKNVILKAVVAACLTSEEVILHNIPLISDLFIMLELVKEIGGEVHIQDNTVRLKVAEIKSTSIPLEMGAKIRTSSMFLSPLLARAGKASIPNPGGCRIGARPIDRHIKGLEKMNVEVGYASEDGYFHAKTDGLTGTEFAFEKNSHTGTETLILAAVLANGKTVIRNAAAEPEVDDLIQLLNSMGAKAARAEDKTIEVEGVNSLHGTEYTIMPDRNEVVTFAVLSALTGGNIWIEKADTSTISTFLESFKQAGGSWEEKDTMLRFFIDGNINPVTITTNPHPGFMTDWQGPWAIFMTQANGESILHETVYEYRFGYVDQLLKMGAKIKFFNPPVDNPHSFYNFNYNEKAIDYQHAIKIYGKTPLHNGILKVTDLRAGATLIIAALIAKGESVIFGVEHLERGYENIEARLKAIGANITLISDTI